MSKRPRKSTPGNKADQNYLAAKQALQDNPILSPLLMRATITRQERADYPRNGLVAVDNTGVLHAHPDLLAEVDEWRYALAHCLLHLAFGHVVAVARPREWNIACDYAVARFIAEVKMARLPEPLCETSYPRGENELYQHLCLGGVPDELCGYGSAGRGVPDMLPLVRQWGRAENWPRLFSVGVSCAVSEAVDRAGGIDDRAVAGAPREKSAAARAKSWFISSYPLMGSMAAAFEIVEDLKTCRLLDIQVAAVDPSQKKIYINPLSALSERECRFVMAHELLHVGLRHAERCRGRDPYLWNIACDYVINAWLIEMRIGDAPGVGLLHDPQLAGASAESLYDRMATDLRRFRKLSTFKGSAAGDILGPMNEEWWKGDVGTSLDDFYRRCLAQGLTYHQEAGRGLLPAGLVEEIRAQSFPPIPWDVQLAQWLDVYFAPVERRRTYARPSRRQSSTPDIPRPRWVPVDGWAEARTFGVVLDTSGSMERPLLAHALGAIASYCVSREVPLARVVFCDAHPYDQGYLAPEDIAGRVRVRGRGGTVLQPAIDLLEAAEDFPEKGPLLIITDGGCDVVKIRREHAFLMPRRGQLPFVARGKVFRM
ncbi:MAG: peptidase [bacterium]|nr:peptidase [bacterium]